MFIDTHTHLYDTAFDEDRSAVVQMAVKQGISKMLLPNIDLATIQPMLKLVADYPNQCFAMQGLHPCSVNASFKDELNRIRSISHPYVAIGEIGIDLYWDKTYRVEQEEALLIQIEWALEDGLPIVIHSRESMDLILDILEAHKFNALQGVFHCFTGDKTQATRALNLGFYLGIGGVITFKKNGDLRDVVQEIPLNRLVLETDAPYLSPHPKRGKRNESQNIRLVAERLAEIKSMTLDEIAIETTGAANRLFSL